MSLSARRSVHCPFLTRADFLFGRGVKTIRENVLAMIFSDQGETACRDAPRWRVLECSDLN